VTLARPTRLVVEPTPDGRGLQEVTADVLTFDGGVLRAWLEGELVGELPLASVARVLLRGAESAVVRSREQHANAYQPWTQEHDDALRAAHAAGTPLKELAGTFGRRPSAVQSRLARLGLLAPPDYSVSRPGPGGEQRFPNAGLAWTATDDDELMTKYGQGEDVDTLALHFERSPGAVRSRLTHLGVDVGSAPTASDRQR
jgi:hypothetical protein